ncbi:Pre-rRNA-processing protein RIX1 [Pleurotus pulmonarius]
MESAGKSLATFLQIHLASDGNAVTHLPFILTSLCSNDFQPSPHLVKWTNRLNALIRSSDPSAQWAGLCIAHKTSQCSRSLMIDSAANWLASSMSITVKTDCVPVAKAAIRLAVYIFMVCADVPEFQRQISTPNVAKFTSSLINLAEKSTSTELKNLCFDTLTNLTLQYPNLNRPSHAAMSSLTLKFLSGSFPAPIDQELMVASSRLFSVLHHTGGKVASATLWRSAVDSTLSFSWSSFTALRTTSGDSSGPRNIGGNQVPQDDIPLRVDALRCCTQVLCDLLKSRSSRPVVVPVGALADFAMALLKCNREEVQGTNADPFILTQEILVLPKLLHFACDLLKALAQSVRHHFTPHLPQVIAYMTYHLQQDLGPAERLHIITTLHTLLVNSLPLSSPFLPNRLVKALLPTLTVMLEAKSQGDDTKNAITGNGSKKSKKRARDMEGDQVLRTTTSITYPTKQDGETALVTLDVLKVLHANPELGDVMQSLSSRVLLSMFLALPQISPSALSPDISLHRRLYQKLETICVDLSVGTSSSMSRSVPMVAKATLSSYGTDANQEAMERLLHPRLPPLLRTQPHIESLVLSRKEESKEEAEARTELGLTLEDEEMATDIPAPSGLPIQDPPPNAKVTTPAAWQPQAFTPVNHVQPQTSQSPSGSGLAVTPTVDQASQPPATWEEVTSKNAATSAAPPSVSRALQEAPAASTFTYNHTHTRAEPAATEELPSIDMDSDSDPGSD